MINVLREKKAVTSIIPQGCTQYLQLLDTSGLSVFKSHYQAAADEFIDQQGPRHRLKLSAKQQRILCTRLISTAWARTVQSVDFERAFMNIGYIWVDDSPISPRTLPGFVFDPKTVLSDTVIIEENDDDDENDAQPMKTGNHCHAVELNNNPMKQLRLDQFITRH